MSLTKLRQKDKSGVCYYDIFLANMKNNGAPKNLNGYKPPEQPTGRVIPEYGEKKHPLYDKFYEKYPLGTVVRILGIPEKEYLVQEDVLYCREANTSITLQEIFDKVFRIESVIRQAPGKHE